MINLSPEPARSEIISYDDSFGVGQLTPCEITKGRIDYSGFNIGMNEELANRVCIAFVEDMQKLIVGLNTPAQALEYSRMQDRVRHALAALQHREYPGLFALPRHLPKQHAPAADLLYRIATLPGPLRDTEVSELSVMAERVQLDGRFYIGLTKAWVLYS